MRTVKYTNSIDFKCLEDLRETAREVTLVHMGKEECKPYHAFSGIRDEYIIHFILSGSGFYSANGSTWPLSAGQMFLIYPEEPVVYCADKNTPWTYVWIGVSDIAAKIGITRSHLNHAFQKELNISVQKFLIDFRMHKAANLLVSTTISIKEISNQVGYKDQLVFSKAFKKKFGLSPRNYRTHTDKMEIRKNRP